MQITNQASLVDESTVELLFVLGMHRSGTSLITHSLELLGYSFGDNLLPPQPDNPKGFWEDADIVSFNNNLLIKQFSSWDKPMLFFDHRLQWQEEDLNQALALLKAKLAGQQKLAIKDPRVSLLLPFWKEVLHRAGIQPNFILVYRNPLDVAASLSARNQFQSDKSINLWMIYNSVCLQGLRDEKFLVVDYANMVEAPIEQINRVAGFIGESTANPQDRATTLEGVIDPDLCHSSSSLSELSARFPNHPVEALANWLYEKRLQQEVVCPDNVLTEIQSEINTYLQNGSREYFLEELKSLIVENFRFKNNQEQLQNKIEGQLRDIENLQGEISRISEEKNKLRQDFTNASNHLNEKIKHVEILMEDVSLKESQIAEYDNAINAITSSVSFKTGRLITYLPRKLLEFFQPLIKGHPRIQIGVDALKFLLKHPGTTLKYLNSRSLKAALGDMLFDPAALASKLSRFTHNAVKPRQKLSYQFKTYSEQELEDYQLALPVSVSNDPRVSVIIPVYNQLAYTLNCLESIVQNWPTTPCEVIVVDDCSNDSTEKVLKGIKGLTYYRHPENLGFLKSCNKAVDLAKGEYVFLLNNDTAVLPGWLDTLIDVFANHKDAGLVGSRLLFPNGRLQEAGGIIWNDASGWNYGRNDDPEKPEYNYLKAVDYVSGAAIMFPRGLFLTLDKFDERYVPAYYEDTDLAFKVRAAGKKVYLQPKSNIVHFEGVTSGTDTSQGVKQYQLVNQQQFAEKWHTELETNHFPSGENVFQARDRSRDKNTILVIDHHVPHFDQDAGSRSTFQYLQFFVELGGNVKFLGDNFFPHEPYTSMLQQMGIEVLYGNDFALHWKEWLAGNIKSIDVVYIHRPDVAAKYIDFINTLPDKPKTIYFGHDLHYLRLERQYKLEGKASILKEAEAWKQKEQSLFPKFDQIFYPSTYEVEEISKTGSFNVKALPLYVLGSEKNAQYSTERQGLLFVGGFRHPPNIDGVTWFCREVMPLVKVKIPDICLHIVGSNVVASVESLADQSVIIHGYLSEEALNDLYSQVKISVVPLRYGAGVKGKVLEAMAKGVPVVTTEIGAEGIPDNARCLSISNTANEMAEAIVSLYENLDESKERIRLGYKVIDKYFSPVAVLDVIEQDFLFAKK